MVPSGHLFHSYDPLAEAIKATTTTNVRRRCCTVGDHSEPASAAAAAAVALPDFGRVSVFKINENRFASRLLLPLLLLPWQPINMAKSSAMAEDSEQCIRRAHPVAAASAATRPFGDPLDNRAHFIRRPLGALHVAARRLT